MTKALNVAIVCGLLFVSTAATSSAQEGMIDSAGKRPIFGNGAEEVGSDDAGQSSPSNEVTQETGTPAESLPPVPGPEETPSGEATGNPTTVVPLTLEAPSDQYASLQPGYWERSPLPAEGMAMYYNPGVMDRVLAYRRQNNQITICTECIGYVALLRAGDINRRVWMQRPGMPVEGPFQVIDVAAVRDIPSLIQRDWVVDVDHGTAQRWKMNGPIPVVVLADPSQARY